MKGSKKTLLTLLAVACIIACGFTFVACGNLGSPDKTVYTLTVTTEEGDELDFTGITAQWKSGGKVKAAVALDETGVASALIAKGDYTVTLTGAALADYDWQETTVSATDFTASIALTKKQSGEEEIDYSVTVTTNDSGLNLTTLAVQWTGSNGEPVSSQLDADGKATKKLAKGDYAVTLVGLQKPDYYEVTGDTVSATKTEANITVTAIARDLSVTVASPVALPEDVKLQVKDGGENYGEPAAIAENKATVKVPFNKAVTLELVGLSAYDYLECSPVPVAAADKTATVTVSLATVTYKVTVNKGEYEGELTGITVTLEKDGNPVAGATELPLTEGVASVDLVAGEYTVILNGLDMVDYKYELSEPLTVENHETTVTIKSTLIKLEKRNSDGATVYEATTVFESEEEVKRVVLPSELTAGKFYSILVSSESDLFNDHNFTIAYNMEDGLFTIGKDRQAAGEVSYVVIRLAEGEYEFTLKIKDGGLFAEEINISVQEYEEIDTKIELDVEKEIYATTTYNFTAPSNNAFLLTVDPNGLAKKDYAINMGEGPAIGNGATHSNLTYEFFAEEGEPFSISVDLYTTGTIKLTITESYGEFKLGEETTVSVPAGFNSGIAKPVFKVPVKGIYKLELLGEVANNQVIVSLEGKNPIIEGAQRSAEFTAERGNLAIHFINNTSTGAFDLTAKVTLVKATGNDLEVGGEISVVMGGVDAPAKINLVDIKAGKN